MLTALGFHRTAIVAKSALRVLADPSRGDAVAQIGEATGGRALERIYHQMMGDPVGRRLLRERRRINSQTMPAEHLRSLPAGSLGRAYLAYMESNDFSPDERPEIDR